MQNLCRGLKARLVLAAVPTLFLAGQLVAQESIDQSTQPQVRAFNRFVEYSVGTLLHPEGTTSVTACSGPKGTLSFGVPVSGLLGDLNSCYDAPSGFWADFYTFSGSAGQRVRLAFTSNFSALTTIQDYSTGTVLASSNSCGFTFSAATTASTNA